MEDELLIYMSIGASAFFAYKFLKLRKDNTYWAAGRLDDEMNYDLKILSSVPRGPYVTHSGDDQRIIDDLKDSEILEHIEKKYSTGELDHLWELVRNNSLKNELRAKQKRIEKLLEKIDFSKLF